ncbi:aromatic amino acid exporter [Vibrio cholerae]|nr:aromatic amino acid exporter [Vibrio cholerae]
MALTGAFIWAIYCNVTQRLARGQNAIVLFFAATAATLWLQYALSNEPALSFTGSSMGTLLLTGIVMGSGYALCDIRFADLLVGDSRVEFINRGGA